MVDMARWIVAASGVRGRERQAAIIELISQIDNVEKGLVISLGQKISHRALE